MTQRTISVNRTAVGLIALGCLLAALVLLFVMADQPDNGSLIFLQGGFARVGMLMAAFWLALPGRNQSAAWANLSPRTIIGLLLAAILTMRIQLRILIPVAVVTGIVLLVLRPRTKKRPAPMRENPF